VVPPLLFSTVWTDVGQMYPEEMFEGFVFLGEGQMTKHVRHVRHQLRTVVGSSNYDV
jgi:hypothetical protein